MTFKNSGSALISVLMLCALFGLLALNIFRSTQFIQAAQTTEIHSLQARSLSEFDILDSLENDASHLSASSYDCLSLGSTVGKVSINRKLCLSLNRPPTGLLEQSVIDGRQVGQFPAFNYSRTFKSATSCPENLYQCSGVTPSGFELTALASCSHFLCEMPQIQLANDYVLRGNLSAAKLHAARSAQVVIAASGFIDIHSQALFDNDTLIIAGGDLHISTLISAAGSDITLISATGRIVVNQIRGSPALKAIGRAGVDLPEITASPQWLLPEGRPVEVLGFASLERAPAGV